MGCNERNHNAVERLRLGLLPLNHYLFLGWILSERSEEIRSWSGSSRLPLLQIVNTFKYYTWEFKYRKQRQIICSNIKVTLSVSAHLILFPAVWGLKLSAGGRMRRWVVRVLADCFTAVWTQVLFPDLQDPRGDSPCTVLNAVYFYSNCNVFFVIHSIRYTLNMANSYSPTQKCWSHYRVLFPNRILKKRFGRPLA